ncbi:YwmB family TATA-box binding protein [Dethiobacter alkaliphilus]|uniref:TATA-box binding protein n=1 Tax=Dethiobacter alkaliphilus AHT 1 TaxID=555088 RepID=C0GGV4_DETAL|nr:YwmB family TATA-box binding protein [Dethiobacter alkaliphilus]EEG77545.1 hypothetical protein DealDRAFT_1668 [Dethiobacter alkaliphilus AHT 1]
MNRTKIIVLVLLIGLMVVVLQQKEEEPVLTEMEALETIFNTAGASVVEGEVQFYAALESRYYTMDELESILLEVADLLGIEGGPVDRGEGESFRVLDVYGETAFGPKAHVVLQSNPGDKEYDIDPQTYLLIICRDESVSELATIISRLEEIVIPYAPSGQLSFYLTGEIPARQTKGEMESLAERALSAVRGSVVEGMEDEQMVSLTAYTPMLGRSMAIDDEKFNLNLALRYDDYNDTTILWAGFPLIHGTY